jgi:flagellar biogenesis protein FliO
MTPALAFFLFGAAAGFVMVRLSRKRGRHDKETRWLEAAAWVLASASLAFAAMLVAFMILSS